MKRNEAQTGKGAAKKLTARQRSAIPAILSCPTYSQGIRKAKIGRKTFYQWLKMPEFKAELDRQRDELAAEAFGALSQGLSKAVKALVGLLDTEDERLRRLACKDIIEHVQKHLEVKQLETRIAAVEAKLQQQNQQM